MPDFEIITTTEVAILLNCKTEDAIHLLKAIGIKHGKCCKAYLWDKKETLLAIQTFKTKKKGVKENCSQTLKLK